MTSTRDFPSPDDATSQLEARVAANGGSGRLTVVRPNERLSAVISAAFLIDLMQSGKLAPQGLQVLGATITGKLNCADLRVTVPIRLLACNFQHPVVFSRAQLHRLDLRRSTMPRLAIDEAEVTQSLLLRRANFVGSRGHSLAPQLDGDLLRVGNNVDISFVRATGTIRFESATIGGWFAGEGAKIEPECGAALSLDGADVRGSVRLNKHFTATGKVRLVGATIGGSFSCRGAVLKPEKDDALSLDGADVEGSVRLNEHFTATGKVRLVGATIGGSFSAQGAVLKPEEGIALSLDRVKVKGSVFLDEGFMASGTIRLLGAKIDGQLACAGAKIVPTEGEAFSMDRAEVHGNVILNEGFEVTGTLSALGATLGTELRLELPVSSNTRRECALLRMIMDDGLAPVPQEPMAPASVDPAPVHFDLRNALLNALVLSQTVGAAHADLRAGAPIVSLDSAVYSGLTPPEDSQSVVHSPWRSRMWRSILGTRELHSEAGLFYVSILESTKRLPDAGEVHTAPYDVMARVLRNAGREQLGQELLLAKHRQLRAAQAPRRRLGRWLLDVSVGYGYRPQLAIVWAATIYLASVLLLWAAVYHNGIVATSLATTPGLPTSLPSPLHSQADYPSFSAWNYAFGSLVYPFLHLPDTDAWRPNAVNGWGIVVRVVRWVEPVAFWALALTLGAMFTRLLTRDRD